MIDKVILQNFQSHAHSVFDFSDGITSIIGESDNGKTALFRGFDGVRENKNFGLENASHWITDVNEKGTITLNGAMAVTVVFSEGKFVTRERNDMGYNGYYIGDYRDEKFEVIQTFDKVGKGVPHPVRELFNMEAVNVQNQHDSMFLLSESGQDVARYFNKLIKLDVADTALAGAERRKRKAKAGVTAAEEEIRELEEERSKLDWVDEAVVVADRIEMTDAKVDAVEHDIESVETIIDNMIAIEKLCVLPEFYNEALLIMEKIDKSDASITSLDDDIYKMAVLADDIYTVDQSIKNADWINAAGTVMFLIDGIDLEFHRTYEEMRKLQVVIGSIELCRNNMEESEYAADALSVLDKIDSLDDAITSTAEKIDDIDLMMTKIKTSHDKIFVIGNQIKALQAELPDSCPTCGQSLERGTHAVSEHS